MEIKISPRVLMQNLGADQGRKHWPTRKHWSLSTYLASEPWHSSITAWPMMTTLPQNQHLLVPCGLVGFQKCSGVLKKIKVRGWFCSWPAIDFFFFFFFFESIKGENEWLKAIQRPQVVRYCNAPLAVGVLLAFCALVKAHCGLNPQSCIDA